MSPFAAHVPRGSAEHVLVTGGAGFIGSHLVERLLREGADVTVVDSFDDFYDPAIKRANLALSLAHPACHLIEADVRNRDQLGALLGDAGIDIIVHLAARAGVRPSIDNPELYASVNVDGTVAMLELARVHRVRRFVFGSSSSVYGDSDQKPFAEDDPVSRPISPYAATKRAGELLCHTYAHLYGLSVICLRLFTVYGPRQRPDLAIHKFARLIVDGLPVPVFGDGTMRRDFTFVEDTVSGILSAIRWTRSASGFEIVNLGAGGSVTVNEMVDRLAEALGRTAKVERRLLQPGDVDQTVASTDKAERMLGFRPRTQFATGMQRFAEWFMEKEVAMARA